jgi:hypothetical protein
MVGLAAVLAPAGPASRVEASGPADTAVTDPAPAPMMPGVADTLPGSTRFIPIPFVYYSPETRLAGGVAAVFLFGDRVGETAADPRSSVSGVGIHTQNEQNLVSAGAERYLEGGVVELRGGATYGSFPTSFFGIGNMTRIGAEEEYTPETLTLTFEGLRDVGRGFWLGARADADRLRLAEVQEGGTLEAGQVPGARGGWTSTVTALARFDTRDRRVGPSRGVYVQTEAGAAGRALGSDYPFGSYLVDTRAYVPAFASQVVALRGIARVSSGTVPFHRMPALGGGELLRGYYEGRFRDRQLAAFQLEDRIPIKGRLKAALFAEAGQVAGTPSRLEMERFHLAWGWGVRLLLSREDALVLRLDQGYGSDQSGTYLSIGEAY